MTDFIKEDRHESTEAEWPLRTGHGGYHTFMVLPAMGANSAACDTHMWGYVEYAEKGTGQQFNVSSSLGSIKYWM